MLLLTGRWFGQNGTCKDATGTSCNILGPVLPKGYSADGTSKLGVLKSKTPCSRLARVCLREVDFKAQFLERFSQRGILKARSPKARRFQAEACQVKELSSREISSRDFSLALKEAVPVTEAN